MRDNKIISFLTYSNLIIFANYIKEASSLISAIAIICSAIAIIWQVVDNHRTKKIKEINSNLKARDRLEPILTEYVTQANKNNTKDIKIRFIYFKNYPRDIENDGFKHRLKLDYIDEKLINSSWIDSIGILFQEDPWYWGNSIYIDKNGIFFFALSGKTYKNFTEYNNVRLIKRLPFANIINFDFKEQLEYEPTFYIKYPYTSYHKLYSTELTIKAKIGNPHLMPIKLNSKNHLSKYTFIRYKFLQLKILCRKLLYCSKKIPPNFL